MNELSKCICTNPELSIEKSSKEYPVCGTCEGVMDKETACCQAIEIMIAMMDKMDDESIFTNETIHVLDDDKNIDHSYDFGLN